MAVAVPAFGDPAHLNLDLNSVLIDDGFTNHHGRAPRAAALWNSGDRFDKLNHYELVFKLTESRKGE